MKKAFSFLLLMIHLGILGFGQTSFSRFSLKLSGGVRYLSVGELNSAMEGMSDYLYATSSNVSGRYENMHLGMNFNLEVVYFVTDRLGIGLGGGFFQVSKKDMIHFDSSSTTYPRTISCLPLTLNVHYAYPLGSKLNLSLSGGVGYYLASFEITDDWIEVTPSATNTYTASSDFKAKGTVGLQASIGLEMELTNNLGIFLAAIGSYATVSGFTGDENINSTVDNVSRTSKESGVRLWALDLEKDGVKYPFFWVYKVEPSWGDVSNVHELKIDLSGVSLGVGLWINF